MFRACGPGELAKASVECEYPSTKFPNALAVGGIARKESLNLSQTGIDHFRWIEAGRAAEVVGQRLDTGYGSTDPPNSWFLGLPA